MLAPVSRGVAGSKDMGGNGEADLSTSDGQS